MESWASVLWDGGVQPASYRVECASAGSVQVDPGHAFREGSSVQKTNGAKRTEHENGQAPALTMAVCEVCGADDFAPLFSLGERGSYRQCRACAMVALDTQLEFDYTNKYYVEELLKQAIRGERLYTHIIENIERHHAIGTLVEVGCSVGTQLHLACKRGWRVLGFERQPDCPEI